MPASSSPGDPMTVLGVAVVGLGIGAAHARAYAELPACRLRWLYDLDGHRATEVAAEIGQGAPAESFETVLADPEVAIVSIASYDDTHATQTVAALRAGKHVFVEKPLCRSLDELRAIRRAWEAGPPRHLASNLVLRTAPLYRWLRESIGHGRLGTVYAVDGDYLYGRLEKITDGWRGAIEDYSVILGGGVHLVDLMMWLTGEKPGSVTAAGNRLCTAGTRFRYNDFATATFQFPSGLVGRITANFGCVHHHQHVLRVFGTRATFIHDDQGPRLYDSRQEDAVPRRPELPALPTSKGELIAEFVTRIGAGIDPRPDAQHDFDVISACLAAESALLSGKPTKVEEVA